MKTIFNIARTELRTLFYSPIAWFLLVVFMIQCGMAYTQGLDQWVRQQELGGPALADMKDLTLRILCWGFCGDIMQNLYLYIPLLTMGLISREINGGTIKLLYSSPVKIRQLIFGKYLAMMIYCLLLALVAGIFMVSGICHIKSADGSLLWSAVLGFYLLLCAYVAIGLFMSCLTTYQVVAAISTFVMIGILSYIGGLWQRIDFVRDLTYFLSLSGRAQHMQEGLITSKDILYFVLIAYIFIALSIYKLKAGRESKPALVKAGRYFLVVVSALILGYISSRPRLTGYWDVTANQSKTLTLRTQSIVKEFGDKPLEVTLYNNLLGRFAFYGLPEYRNGFLGFWESYTRFKPGIDFNYVNYYDSTLDNPDLFTSYPGKTLKELAQLNAKSFKMKLSSFKTPEEIRKIIDLRPELNRLVMQLTFQGRTSFLRVYDDTRLWPSETEVAAAFKRLQQAKRPKIVFQTGDFERSIQKIGDRDYKTLTNLSTFRYALVNQGFDIDTVSLADRDLPADISTLVIADPKKEFSAAAWSRIRQYIDLGGNLLIAGEPGKQAVLNPLLQELGVQLMEGVIVQPSREFSPDLLLGNIKPAAAGFTREMEKSYKDSLLISMPGATGLSYTAGGAFIVQPLLMTDSSKNWIKEGKLVVDSADVVFSAAQGDRRISAPTALGLTRTVHGKEQRIVITGDADFMSNSELSRYNISTANFDFNTALFSWLDYGAFPIDTYRPPGKDNRLTVSSEQVEVLTVIYVWVMPAIVLILGTILLIRRKRR